MIFYSYSIVQESEDCNTDISPKTNREYDYTYYMELSRKYRDRTLEDIEYFDFMVLHRKYKWYA